MCVSARSYLKTSSSSTELPLVFATAIPEYDETNVLFTLHKSCNWDYEGWMAINIMFQKQWHKIEVEKIWNKFWFDLSKQTKLF